MQKFINGQIGKQSQNIYMFCDFDRIAPPKMLVEGYPQVSKIATFGDGCASYGR